MIRFHGIWGMNSLRCAHFACACRKIWNYDQTELWTMGYGSFSFFLLSSVLCHPRTLKRRPFNSWWNVIFTGSASSEILIDYYFYASLRAISLHVIIYCRPIYMMFFFALNPQVCQPIMPDGTNCSNPVNHNRYIEDFTCLGVGSSARMLKEVRLSFPSGHSSYTAFTMIYCVVRYTHRQTWMSLH